MRVVHGKCNAHCTPNSSIFQVSYNICECPRLIPFATLEELHPLRLFWGVFVNEYLRNTAFWPIHPLVSFNLPGYTSDLWTCLPFPLIPIASRR